MQELTVLRNAILVGVMPLCKLAGDTRTWILCMQRIRSEQQRLRKHETNPDCRVFCGKGSGQSVDDTRDEIEAHSVEHTFKPFEAYELVKILGLMSSRPVLVHDFPSAELGLKLRIHDALSERNKY